MSLSKDVVIRLLGDASSAERAIKAAADAAEVSVGAYKKAERAYAQQQRLSESAAKKQREAMESAGRHAVIFGAVVAAGLAVSAKAAVDWETAWAGVQKVVDGTPRQMAALEVELRKLATILPATHEEIAGVAEAAGQLGIKRQDIVEFTKTAIALGVSTNLSAEEAANGLARLANIIGTSSKDVDRLGSVLVALGNAGASTEKEILDMGLRIAAAGHQAHMSEGDILGIANAMSSMGIEAEAGGTAISTVIKKINNAVLDGSDELKTYAAIAGMSADQFAKAWRDNAATALTAVVRGLGNMQAAGQNVNTVLTDLGLNDIRVSDAMLRLSSNAQLLEGSLVTGNRAWAENNALMNEANKRYETTASKMQLARNTLNDAAITIGETLLPALASGADLVADFARGFNDLPGWMQDTVVVIGAVTAGIALLGGGAAIAVPKVLAFRATMQTLTESSSASVAAVGKFGKFMTGPWGIAIGIATVALGGLITWLGKSSQASQEARDYQHELAAALRESKGAIDENVRALAAKRAEETKVAGRSLLEWADKLGVSLPRVTDALLGNRDAYQEIRSAIEQAIAAEELRASHLTGGGGSEAQAIQNRIAGYRNLLGAFGDLGLSMGGAVAENQRLADAEKGSGAAADGTATSMDSLSTAQGDVAATGEKAATAAEKLADAIDALNGPTLDLRDATRGYQDAIDKAAASVKEHGKTLDINTDEGRANAEALDLIAQKAMEQANAIAAGGGSYDAFRNSLQSSRQALIDAATSMGATDEEAQALADSILRIPDAAEVDIQLPTYRQVLEQLADVQDAIEGVPPETWTNVGVLSEKAIADLEAVGIKTRTLPDGTVEVMAATATAAADLDAFVRTKWQTEVSVRVKVPSGIHLQVDGMFGGGTVTERAEGGPFWPGTFLVGEKGPEILQLGGTGFVTPAALTAQAMQAAGRPVGRGVPTGPGIPVGSYIAARSGSGSSPAPIDYGRLAAAVAEGRALVHVDHMEVAREETAQETAERLNWMATTKG